MPASTRLRLLNQEIRLLRAHLLPKKFDPLGSYPMRIHVRAVAFRVLAHAEVESYLEDRALETAQAAVRNWKNAAKATRALLCLLSFVEEDPPVTVLPGQPSQAKLWPLKVDVTTRVDVAHTRFAARVKKNHGLREEHILSLLLPIGLEAASLDPLLLTDLNNFADRRGEAAHTSASAYRARSLPDPKNELTEVLGIVNRLKPIDEALTLLSR